MLSWCFDRFTVQRGILLGGPNGFARQGRNLRQGFLAAYYSQRATDSQPSDHGRKSQLCCVFNLQGPIWRHHRVMRSDTFPFLIAVAPVAWLPEGCSGQEGHKYFLMSINLITVLCK